MIIKSNINAVILFIVNVLSVVQTLSFIGILNVLKSVSAICAGSFESSLKAYQYTNSVRL